MTTLYLDGDGPLVRRFGRLAPRLTNRYGITVTNRGGKDAMEAVYISVGKNHQKITERMKARDIVKSANILAGYNDEVPPFVLKPKDVKPKDVKPKDVKPKDVKPTKPELHTTTTYGAIDVMNAIVKHMGVKHVQFFGNSSSDAHIFALSRVDLDKLLKQDRVDNLKYTSNTDKVSGFDCENFAETLRVNTAKIHNINSCGVIWGDGHAFNLFVVSGKSGPEIVVIEPQTDRVVQNLTGSHSIEKRCHILL